ncbi:hypothetical protein [Clostridium tyrobutyricum]|uniref:hypothetical protein n=1 Tax=Clostridium tyrobutyricum TaxID=1519 RepID=UPI001C38B904|nr:hypothetical protein [Clostridium tyrobutyricum]MBV4422911.1 hypothetical protein [Clostridium tyrobutyricum]MBV4423663.1 hypothetical protein [Clostridium tyrobutyricum]
MNDFCLIIPQNKIEGVLVKFKEIPKTNWPWKFDKVKRTYYFETTDVIRELYGGFYKSTRKILNNSYLLNPSLGMYLNNFKNTNIKLINLGSEKTKDDSGKGTSTIRWTF